MPEKPQTDLIRWLRTIDIDGNWASLTGRPSLYRLIEMGIGETIGPFFSQEEFDELIPGIVRALLKAAASAEVPAGQPAGRGR